GGQVAVFAGCDVAGGALGPVHAGGEQALAVAPFQCGAGKPAGGRRLPAVLGAVQGLVFVVDDQVGGALGQAGDQPGGDLGVQVPVAGGDILGAPVTGLEGAGGKQLDGRALGLDLEDAGGEGGSRGGGCILHAASVGG